MTWEAKHIVPGYSSWRSERFVVVWSTKMQCHWGVEKHRTHLYFMPESFSRAKTYLKNKSVCFPSRVKYTNALLSGELYQYRSQVTGRREGRHWYSLSNPSNIRISLGCYHLLLYCWLSHHSAYPVGSPVLLSDTFWPVCWVVSTSVTSITSSRVRRAAQVWEPSSPACLGKKGGLIGGSCLGFLCPSVPCRQYVFHNSLQ